MAELGQNNPQLGTLIEARGLLPPPSNCRSFVIASSGTLLMMPARGPVAEAVVRGRCWAGLIQGRSAFDDPYSEQGLKKKFQHPFLLSGK